MCRLHLPFGFSNCAFKRAVAAIVAIFPLLCSLALTQNEPSEDSARASDSQVEQDSSQATAHPATSPKVPTKKLPGQFVVAPIPISSPALGSVRIPVVGYIFPLSSHDEVSPPSVIGASGLITDNGSRAFAVAGQFFMKQDSYRITAGFFQGNLNYNFYGIGIMAGNAGLKLPLKQDGSVFLCEFLRRVRWRVFLGPRVLTGHSTITLRPGGSVTVPAPLDLGLRTALTSLGLSVARDTRDNRFYPTRGTVFEFTADFFAEALGSKYSFQSYKAVFNSYWSLSERQVIAYNAYFCATGGQPPFYGNCIYGIENELRGYEAGRYLDPYMVATQLEYRLTLTKRFGVVAFGGIGGMTAIFVPISLRVRTNTPSAWESARRSNEELLGRFCHF